MKRQKQKEIKTNQMTDIVSNHKMKEVSPPEGARRDAMSTSGKAPMNIKQATATWFKAAKEQNPSSGFLDVPSEDLKPLAAHDREMLYKGKNKK